jgi:hypothetical protein
VEGGRFSLYHLHPMAARITSVMLILVSLGASACAGQNGPGRPGVSGVVLSPVPLISQASALDGQTVAVDGYFTFNTDTRALWESEAAHVDVVEQRRGSDFDYWSKCITIYSAGPDLRRYDRTRVRLTGRVTIVQPDEVRHLWVCNDVSLEVTAVTPL